MDIIFKNVKMYDGTGKNPGKICDVGVENDKIAAVGNLENAEAARVIDCTGLTMIPGMIDVHTHSDFAMFNDSQRGMALMQGITTEIISACGIGCVPLSGSVLKEYVDNMEGLTGKVPEGADVSSVDGYFKSLPKTGVNVAMQIAHSPLRAKAAGHTKDCVMTPEMWKKFEKYEREAFEQGAVSISTGMSYFPAAFCETDELVKMAKVAAEYDAPFSVHQRNILRKPIPGFNSFDEIVGVARESGCHMVFSHYRTGPWCPGLHEAVCAPLEKALSEGLRVSADFYPYDNGCTYLLGYLPFDLMTGGAEELLAKLRDPREFEAIATRLDEMYPHGIGGIFTYCPNHPQYLGGSFMDIAAREGTTAPRLVLKVLRDDNLAAANVGGTPESKEMNDILNKDFAYFLTKEYYNVGSDTIPSHTFPHPRSYGAFAKALRIALDNAIGLDRFAAATAGKSAEIYHIKNRGIIAVGNFADLAIFSESEINATATFENPRRYAVGMKYVTVNGKLAVDGGTLSGEKAGVGIRRN